MIKYRCKICKGEYQSHCDDGLEYYHTCPTLIDEKGKTTEFIKARNENVKEKKMLELREEI